MNIIGTVQEQAELIRALTELLDGKYPVTIQKAAQEKLLELLKEL